VLLRQLIHFFPLQQSLITYIIEREPIRNNYFEEEKRKIPKILETTTNHPWRKI
jgi:hypothetical protein